MFALDNVMGFDLGACEVVRSAVLQDHEVLEYTAQQGQVGSRYVHFCTDKRVLEEQHQHAPTSDTVRMWSIV